MLGVATAAGIGDIALKLWAVSQLPYLAQTRGPFGVGLLLVFNRTPSYDFEHVALSQTLVVVIKFLVLGYLGWRLKGWWRSLGLGLILGGAVANVGNWLVTHAVADFLVMPWATVNLADLLIVVGATVIFAGWGGRVVRHLTRRTRPVMTGKSTNHDPHRLRTVRTPGHLRRTRRSSSAIANDTHPRSLHLVPPCPPNTAATAPTAAAAAGAVCQFRVHR
jgi:lipoprotein signal peptidase